MTNNETARPAAGTDRCLDATEARIAQAFRARGRAFIPYIVAGEPSLEQTARLVTTAIENGADLIEVGIPFSDPTAEGEATKQAGLRALKRKTAPDDVFRIVRSVRSAGATCPIALVSYANVVFAYGTDHFMKACAEAGADAVMLLDVPLEEREEFSRPAASHGICIPSVVYPAPEQRLAEIARAAEGFIQFTCPPGLPEQHMRSLVETVRAHASVPVAVACENADALEAGALADCADGLTVNAEITERMLKGGLESAAAYVRETAASVHGVIHSNRPRNRS